MPNLTALLPDHCVGVKIWVPGPDGPSDHYVIDAWVYGPQGRIGMWLERPDPGTPLGRRPGSGLPTNGRGSSPEPPSVPI